MFRLQFHVRPAWPPLAWLARLNSASDLIEIEHGSGVEASSLGFCEAVWDGDFSQFGFDQTDVVFGSGGRVREGQFVFVSSATTVDRLHWYRSGGAAFVSNSLACLISGIDGTVDPRHEGYFAFFESIILGMHKYQSELATSAGPVHLTYFRNLVWDGQQMLEQDKPVPKRQLDCFDDYYSILKTDFECLKPNLEDPRRTFKLSPLATVSTGYDSPVGAVMGRYAGLRETISMSRGRGEVEDDGSLIAKSLGLEPIVVQSTHSPGDAEQWIPTFVASDSKGEDLYFANAHQELRGRFLITGYSGSRVWDTSDADYADFRRGDQSGLSHTEARLHIGYIHCPVPFIVGTQEHQVRRLGRQAEMSNWSVGGDYDRPVCRRIMETAGVPRAAFGQAKKAASVLLFDRRSFLPEQLQQSFGQWCAEHSLKPSLRESMLAVPRMSLRWIATIDHRGWLPITKRLANEGRIQKFAYYEPKFSYIFPWALHHTMKRYQL